MTWIEISGRVDQLADDHGIEGFTDCTRHHGAVFVNLETRSVVAILTREPVDAAGDYIVVHGISRESWSHIEQPVTEFGVRTGYFAEGKSSQRLHAIVRDVARLLRPAVKSALRTGYRDGGGSLTMRGRVRGAQLQARTRV
ncbi:hypothetical protein GS966_25665 [Rhodococcus hoagii]|nr:hypothetical protein [Prescottella equi]NKS61664.1 hypothetical protein [Prescottella equi]NKZ93231.1 hypothetical protein [Prescottella equi]NKZ93291.1 hypothetical protein [Prescottella equi]